LKFFFFAPAAYLRAFNSPPFEIAMSRRPATIDLSDPREVTFVAAMLDLGGPQFAAEAAKRAGYAETDGPAQRAADLLLGTPRIAQAITKEVRRRFDIATSIAFNTFLEICADPQAPANARISAAQEILNRSTIGPVPSRSIGVVAHTGIEELLERLDAQEHGTDAITIDVVPTAARDG
jgi:hypothetical protein